jgi:hypothetical protein
MASAAVLKATFARLQPVCVELAQCQSSESLSRLHELLSIVNKDALSDLHEYVLFPLRLTLKRDGTR